MRVNELSDFGLKIMATLFPNIGFFIQIQGGFKTKRKPLYPSRKEKETIARQSIHEFDLLVLPCTTFPWYMAGFIAFLVVVGSFCKDFADIKTT